MGSDVRVLDHNEGMAYRNDGIDGVKYAVLQLCAEVRGLRETLDSLIGSNGRLQVDSFERHNVGIGGGFG